MLTVENQREDERLTSHVPVIFSRFGTKFHREYASATFNHSKGGMCFEAAEAFKAGTILFVRVGGSSAAKVYHGNWDHLRSSTLAEVKWCRELPDKHRNCYCVGVRYY